MTTASLYIVATPIGTLGDLSPRAKEILGSVDFIACEDTRHTGKLLSLFGIRSSLESLHAHNENEKANSLVQRLLNSPGKSAALVTDAGTPGVSDPGSFFVSEARKQGVRILTVPGPSALASALAACGFRSERSLFCGFLDRSRSGQLSEFKKWLHIAPVVVVLFESPHRVVDTLRNIAHAFPTVQVCVHKEISKLHEHQYAGAVEDIIAELSKNSGQLGEFVISVMLEEKFLTETLVQMSLDEAAERIFNKRELSAEEVTLPTKELSKKFAEKYNLNARDLYNKIMELKK
jgi:16S rRNA (cytidine1402-2'-O)-methyltransferase